MNGKSITMAMMLAFPVFAQAWEPDLKICNWQDNAEGAISFTFDDGCPNQYSVLVPLMNRYDLKGTFFTITSWADRATTALGWDQLKEMAQQGHEIASHTITHPSVAGPDELRDSRRIIEEHIGKPCLTIAYPYCNYPIDEETLMDTYIAGRICNGQIIPATTTDYYKLSSDVCGTRGPLRTMEQFRTRFEATAEANGWCVLLIHEIDEGPGYSPTSSEELDRTFDYLVRNRSKYWVDTFENVSKYVREHNESTLTVLKAKGKKLTASLTTTLDAEVYDAPLTLSLSLPAGWKGAKVMQGNKEADSRIEDGMLFFKAVPGAGTITVKKSKN